jgi:release factor glutamine methyltransferase
MPDNILEGIYILFPDPWPKTKQLKKRILNTKRLSIFKKKLKDGGFLVFASDIDSYFEMVKKLFDNDESFKLHTQDFLHPHANYVTTKYHQKSIDAGRIARFLRYRYTKI